MERDAAIRDAPHVGSGKLIDESHSLLSFFFRLVCQFSFHSKVRTLKFVVSNSNKPSLRRNLAID